MNAAMHLESAPMLSELLDDIAQVHVDLPVTGLAINSSEVQANDVFIALSGSRCHGLAYADAAIAKGAAAVLYDPDAATETQLAGITSIPTLAIAGLDQWLGVIAARFYGRPSEKMRVLGITGTNGKTSCSQFLAQALDACSIIGTLGYGRWGQLQPCLNTTPDALTLQRLLAQMAEQHQRYVAMEVSSHGLVQGRVNGIGFSGAAVTNISRDHLDYHGSMDAYIEAKAQLLKTQDLDYAVLNLDSPYYQQLLAATPASVTVWGFSQQDRKLASGLDVQAENVQCTEQGLVFDVDYQARRSVATVGVYGEFNVENILVTLTVMLANGVEFTEAIERLQRLRPIPGRMEHYRFGRSGAQVFVDYAHTPDALKNVLISARAYCQNQLWVVFGCGGDRDQGKRPLMGDIACEFADRIIVCDDNPRSEDPGAIVAAILTGCNEAAVQVIHDRGEAIRSVIEQAEAGDCVVIAGKGHETYQEINGRRKPFSDGKLLKTLQLMQRGVG